MDIWKILGAFSPALGLTQLGREQLAKQFVKLTPSTNTIQPPDIASIRSQEWNNYLNLLNQISQGQLPAGYQALAESIQRQAQAAGQNLLNRAMSKMAAQGILQGGLSKQVARDVAAMTASDIANALAKLQGSLFSSALSLLPSTIGAERQLTLQQYNLEQAARQQAEAGLGQWWQSVGNLLSALSTVLPLIL